MTSTPKANHALDELDDLVQRSGKHHNNRALSVQNNI